MLILCNGQSVVLEAVYKKREIVRYIGYPISNSEHEQKLLKAIELIVVSS